MSKHTPGPWTASPRSAYVGTRSLNVAAVLMGTLIPYEQRVANARLIAESPALLALAHQYANECGECAGTRVCPDDSPCTECADVWLVIDRAEGRA